MNTLPKFKDVPAGTKLSTLIHLNDMLRVNYTLSMVKEQAKMKGFDNIAKCRSFAKIKLAISEELKLEGYDA